MATAGSLDYFIRSIWQGGPGVQQAQQSIGGLGQVAKKTDLELAMARQNTVRYQTAVRSMAKEVNGGKISVEAAEEKLRAMRQELGIGETVTKKSGLRWTELASQVQLAQQAVGAAGAVFQKTWQIVGEGSQLELAEGRFDRLAAKIGTTSDALLGGFKAATGGMISNSEMIASATQAIELGLADSEEGIIRWGRVIGELNLPMQQVLMTTANDSRQRLDALGLSVSDVEKRTKAYTDAGIEASKAFDMAVLDALEMRLETLGSAVGTTAGSMQQLEATWQNLTDAGKQWMAVRLSGPIVGVASTMTAVNEATDKGHSHLRNILVVANELGKTLPFTGRGFDGLIDILEDSETATREAIEADERMIQIQQELQEGYARQAAAIIFTSDQLNNYMSLESMYARQGEATAQSGIDAWKDKQQALDNYSLTLNEGLGLEAMYGQAAQLSATQSANAALQAQFYADQQDALNGRLMESFVAFSENEEMLTQYETILAQTATATSLVGGRTADQTAELERLQGIYDKAQQTIADYEAGLKGVNLSDEARNRKIEEQVLLMQNAQTAMGPLLSIQGEYTTATDGGAAASQALNEEIYKQIEALGLGAEATALAGLELGIFTEEQANAMLKAALLEEQIRKQAAAWDGTAGGLEQMQIQIGNYIDMLNNTPSIVETEVRTNYTSTGTPGPVGGGGGPAGTPPQQTPMAAGGVVTGGIPGRDSVPALLMPGERVLTVRQNQAFESGRMGGGVSITVHVDGGGDPERVGNAAARGVLDAARQLGLVPTI